MKLQKVRFKKAVTTEYGQSQSTLTADDGWDIDTGPSGVTAVRGQFGIWVPLPDVEVGHFTPPAPAGKK